MKTRKLLAFIKRLDFEASSWDGKSSYRLEFTSEPLQLSGVNILQDLVEKFNDTNTRLSCDIIIQVCEILQDHLETSLSLEGDESCVK